MRQITTLLTAVIKHTVKQIQMSKEMRQMVNELM